jgi:hypothetical protein
MPGQRFVLFAHPRSGSSNLFEALQLHPRLSILEEPFNEGFSSWYPDERRYLDLVTDEASLDEQLAHMFERHHGVKLLDYQLPRELTARMLLRADVKVVFLRRRNLLRSVVSGFLAEHSGLWKKWEQERPIEQLYADLPPMDIDDIRERIRWAAARLDDYESVIDTRPPDTVRKLVYEDFYFAPPAARRSEFDAVVRFLGAEPFDDPRIEPFLAPETGRINSPETYRLIPNAAEIEASCGCDRTGWLND